MSPLDLYDLPSWSLPPAYAEVREPGIPGLQSIYYETLPWQGRARKAFAFIGLPKQASARRKCPGVVLVHGGMGTAFYNWVQLWNARGYAAIAMDTCGNVPDITKDHHTGVWKRHRAGGPGDWGREDRKRQIPPRETWMYHAVATVIKAHSLLAVRPEVDARSIGITGVSWGGVLTCIVGVLDKRLQWAAPVYGCGFRDPKQMVYDPALFDPGRYLRHASIPYLYLNGTNDFTFLLNNWHRSTKENAGEVRRCLRVNMVHGHGEVSENPAEILDFAEAVRKGGELPPRFEDACLMEDGVASIGFKTKRKITRAEFNFTRAHGYWSDRKWNILPAKLERGRVSAAILPQTQAVFFNLYDAKGLIYSSPASGRGLV